MAAITYLDIRTDLGYGETLHTLELSRGINEHTFLSLSALLPPSDSGARDIVQKLPEKKQLTVNYGENNKILFKGVILNARVDQEGGLSYITVHAASASYQTDIEKNSRSFQDASMMYRKLATDVVYEYPGGDIDDEATEGAVLDACILQYLETDWEFLKRMASRFHAGLVPAVDFGEPKITIGIPSGVLIGKLNEFSYSVQKDLARYMDFSQNTDSEFREVDAIRFIVETDRDFDIGDHAKYMAEPLYIGRKSAKIIKGILQFRYELSTREGLSFPEFHNEHITGLSLRGRVLEVVRDKVKVCLETDESQDAKTAWEFPYASLYTAEGSGGWYCMPEKGDTVFIYFPNREERFAYAMDSIRTQNKESDKIADPSVKYFRTKDGKELKFSREEILITCVDSESAVTRIRLDEKGGIEIATSESVNIKSDKDINIEASESIKMSAAEQIRLKCKTGEITIDTKVDLCGKEVRIN
jgi:hypothetical protein